MRRFPVNFNSKFFLTLSVVGLLCGCEISAVSAQGTPAGKPAENLSVKKQTSARQYTKAADPLVVRGICDEILADNFDRARELLSKYKGPIDEKIEQAGVILDEYDQIKADRKKSKQAEYDKRLKEFEETEGEAFPADANDISEAFAAVTQVFQVSDKEQKERVLNEKYVKKLVDTALEKGREFNDGGRWIDAYAHCYYWLSVLFPDNKEYEKINETLMEKAVIEASLKDNTCETAIERLQGIRAEMLIEAVGVLDTYYISIIDYGEMAKNGIERCKLIGEVLAFSQEKLPFEVTPEQASVWKSSLMSLQSDLEDIANTDLKVVTQDKYIWVYNQLLEIGSATLPTVPQEVIISQFTEASFEELDPVTNLIWPWMVKDFEKTLTQNFTGIGVHIQQTREGYVKVASLLPDTPAYSSGLDAEDVILAINDEPTKEMTIDCVIDKITGPEGTNVVLTVRHKDAPAGKTENIEITRARIIVPTIKGWQRTDDGKWLYMLDTVNKLGYLRITNFTESTSSGMEEALAQLESQGMQGLIIDLRYNPGGYLNTAYEVVDMFVKHGLIVKSQPRWSLPEYKIAKEEGTHPDYPLVVLVNGSSASASEIVAGALQDEKYKRATIVGTRSYGKGSVQVVSDIGYGAKLRYTMAFYYLPSGQPVKTRYVLKKQDRTDWGIEPDIEADLPNYQAVEMLDVQFANDILVKADHNKNGEPVKRYTVHETIKADPQLATALLVLKAKVLKVGGQIQPFVDE